MADGESNRTGDTGRSTVAAAMWVRLAVRVLVVAVAGTMAAGFLDWTAGILVAALVACTYVLLLTVAPRLPAPYGRGRLLRTLQQHGYRVVPYTLSRHLAIGPSGLYLLETRVWQHAVSRVSHDWRIGSMPAEHVIERLTTQAARLERVLGTLQREPPLVVVPVLMVAGRLPEPVMRADRAVIARPRGAVRFILGRPAILEPEEIDPLTDEAEARLFRR